MDAVVTIHPRARERAEGELTHAIGMVVALAAWTMMFGALLFVYLGLRSHTESWPPPGIPALPVPLPALNTVVIVGSSVTLARALRLMRRGERQAPARWMAVTVALGLLFVGLQVVLWRGMWLDGVRPSTGTLGTAFYGLTVLHAIHVAGGVLVLGYLLVRTMRGLALARGVISVRLCAMYWHFVDVVWVVMFVLLFLL